MTITTITNRFGEERQIERNGLPAPRRVSTHWTENDGKDRLSIVVHFGLHYIRSNHAPYFSLTIKSGKRNGRDEFGGADHETILRELPELADLAALHLSDIDGVPLHAEANGWYQLAGACGGFSEKYHAGNAESYGRPKDPLGVFAAHCRITRDEARAIAAEVVAYDVEQREGVQWKDRVSGAQGRKRWAAICESFRPRWKAEADAAIAKYGLTVYGDPWPVKSEVAA